MKMQEWLGVTIIIVGLVSSVWQLNNVKDNLPDQSVLMSVVSDPINAEQKHKIDCATQSVLSNAETLAYEVAKFSVDTANRIISEFYR